MPTERHPNLDIRQIILVVIKGVMRAIALDQLKVFLLAGCAKDSQADGTRDMDTWMPTPPLARLRFVFALGYVLFFGRPR